jgi:MerR family transcriptional regulator, light-induced transcriptional regulator
MERSGDSSFSIGDVARMSGVTEATLRAWERRHGFLAPGRDPGQHRRYSPRDVDAVVRVAEARERGVALAEAIRAATPDGARHGALLGPLRRALPRLHVEAMPKSALIRLSHSIEDEVHSHAEPGLLAGGFQRKRFFDPARDRWRDLAAAAQVAFVLADFPRRRTAGRPPAELPLPGDSPLRQEWVLVWDGPDAGACLVAREFPGQDGADRDRVFDAVWSVDPEAVRHVSRALASIAGLIDESVGARAEECLDSFAPPTARSQLAVGAAIAARALSRTPA